MKTYGSALAQAQEIMSAVILGEIPKWVDTRGDLNGHSFNSVWCDEKTRDSASIRAFLLRRLDKLAKSLRGMRVLGLTETSHYHGCEDETKSFHFHLGTEAEKPLVLVKINLEEWMFHNNPDYDQRAIWGKWEISYLCAIECLVNKVDPTLEGKVILGHRALNGNT